MQAAPPALDHLHDCPRHPPPMQRSCVLYRPAWAALAPSRGRGGTRVRAYDVGWSWKWSRGAAAVFVCEVRWWCRGTSWCGLGYRQQVRRGERALLRVTRPGGEKGSTSKGESGCMGLGGTTLRPLNRFKLGGSYGLGGSCVAVGQPNVWPRVRRCFCGAAQVHSGRVRHLQVAMYRWMASIGWSSIGRSIDPTIYSLL